jgi:hypothetical protein
MRVRPFFWFLFCFTCLGVLIFAIIYRPQIPAVLQVHIEHQHPTVGTMNMQLHLADPQGIPIDAAQVVSSAHMTNMEMPKPYIHVEARGHGDYIVQLSLNMVGPWAITIKAIAQGYLPQQQTYYLQVE